MSEARLEALRAKCSCSDDEGLGSRAASGRSRRRVVKRGVISNQDENYIDLPITFYYVP